MSGVLPSALAGFLAGTGVAVGVVLLVAAVMGWRPGAGSRSTGPGLRERLGSAVVRRAAHAAGAAVPVALLTRWPVMVVATFVLVMAWPSMFGAGRVSAQRIARLEAVAVWTESMRDTIAGSIALEEAIRNTMPSAPEVIQEPLQRLVGALSVHVPLQQALAQMAADFEDESIDLVVGALILNSRLRGPGLVRTLGALATSVREELDMRRRIEQEHRTLRRDARTIMMVVLGFAGSLVVLSRDFLAPYSTPLGQVMLAVVIGVFVAGLVWMRRAADVKEHERFLVGPETLATMTRTGGPAAASRAAAARGASA